MLKLGDWRRRRGLTQLQLSDALATTLSSVCRYENGTRIPEPEMMRKIYVFTEGSISPDNFYDLPELQVSLPLKAAA